MRAYEFITEERKGLYNYYKQQFPNWPDYVVRDFAVKNTKNFKVRLFFEKRLLKKLYLQT